MQDVEQTVTFHYTSTLYFMSHDRISTVPTHPICGQFKAGATAIKPCSTKITKTSTNVKKKSHNLFELTKNVCYIM